MPELENDNDITTDELIEELADIELSAEDAVRIIEAVMENTYRLMLPLCIKGSFSRENGEFRLLDEVMDEILNVETVDDLVKSRVRYVQKFRSIMKRLESESDIEPSTRNHMQERANEIMRVVESEGRFSDGRLADTVTKLKNLRRQGHFRKEPSGPGILSDDEANEAIDKIVEVTTEILDEGQKSIFWAGRYEIQSFISARGEPSLLEANGGSGVGSVIWQSFKGAVSAGAGGAATGARVGSIGGVKGAVAGAIGGAVAGATHETISQVRRRLQRN